MFGRLMGLVSLSALAVVAMAGPQTFAQRVQNIRAGVVILDSAKATIAAQPQSAGPYVLYNLDSNTSIKPTGWNFYNPYASTTITPAIFARWSAIDASTPPVGTRIAKRNAPYWEIFLSQVTDTVLANYDMLVVNPVAFASLNPAEQQRLRRFVDNGGILWIDPAGLNNSTAGMDQFNIFPLPFLQVSVGVGGAQQTDFTNALMNSVQLLTPFDINILDGASPTSYVLQPVNFSLDGANAANMAPIAGGTTFDFTRLQTVSNINGQPSLSVGRIGAGVVVVTARGASIKLNRSQEAASYTANVGYTALDPILEQDGLSAAKLAINMVGMLRESRQQASNSRKTSSSAIDLNPPLLSSSFVNDTTGGYSSNLTSANVSNATPALYKGLLVTTVDGFVKVYNAHPSVNLDNDVNNDAGIQDYSLGAPYDEIWQSAQLPGPLSAPVCAEIPGSIPGEPQDEVLVVDATGTLHIFNLMPRNGDGTLSGVANPGPAIAPPNGAATLDGGLTGVPMAPTVHEGIAYITDTVQKLGVNAGRVWQVDLQAGTYVSSAGPFVLGGGTSTITLPEFSYGPTVGYIPILDNSGGMDKVMYVPFAANLNAGINGAGLTSLWLGAKGEVPTSYEPTGTDTATGLTVTTRASNNTFGALPIYTGPGSLGVKLTLIDNNGNPFSDVAMGNIFQGTASDLGGGVLSFPFRGTVNQLPPNVSGVRVDYTIDWGSAIPGGLTSVERGRIVLPDIAQGPTRILNGGVALSPQGTIYVVNSNESPSIQNLNPPPGGGLYGFREQGRGQFVCVSRYELYQAYSIVLNQSGTVPALSVLNDYDSNLQANFSLLGQTAMQSFEIKGGPSIRNGQVFVTASAVKPAGAPGTSPTAIPVTIVMAFNAEPQTPTFVVGNLADGTEILQPDFARSTQILSPENQTVLASGSYTYDSTSGVISFPNLMSNSQGQIQNCLSLSQPIIIRQPGSADTLLYPDAVGGAVWNPLQWFYVLDGMYPSGGAPVVTGNSVFVSCDSYLYSLLNNNTIGVNGVLYAFNAQIPASQLHAVPNQPWLNQLWTLDTLSGTGDPNILWPQISSVTSVSDFIIKLNQTVLGGTTANPSTTAYGAVGGDGALVSWGANGVYTFSKSNFLICDEGRIVEMDPSGNPVWTSDATASAGVAAINGSADVKQLVRPVRAYLLTDTSILFADPGANRVATLNTNGIETRSISNFQLDPTYPATGYAAGESLNLSAPRDALYYTTYTTMSQVSSLVTLGDGETATSVEYWQHYLIADTGNRRLIEVLDRFYYDPTTQFIGQPVTVNGTPQIGVLLWHSPASASGKQYSYNSVSRVKFPDNNGGHFVYVSGIGGSLPTGVGTGLVPPSVSTTVAEAHDGSGGIVIYDPANPAGVVTFNTMVLPDVSLQNFWDPTTGFFDNVINQSTPAGLATYVQRKGGTRRFSNLNSVTAKIVSDANNNPEVAIMIADGTGVYEALYSASQGQTQTLTVDWMMPNEVFRVIQQTGSPAGPTVQNSQDLRALYARRLDSGEVLIVNGYVGNLRSGAPFAGEVMQVNGVSNYVGSTNFLQSNLGFNTQSITLDLRTAGSSGFRGLVMPVFADRR